MCQEIPYILSRSITGNELCFDFQCAGMSYISLDVWAPGDPSQPFTKGEVTQIKDIVFRIQTLRLLESLTIWITLQAGK